MTYYAKPNFIEHDEWFDENVDPLDLNYYFEKRNILKLFMNSFMIYLVKD